MNPQNMNPQNNGMNGFGAGQSGQVPSQSAGTPQFATEAGTPEIGMPRGVGAPVAQTGNATPKAKKEKKPWSQETWKKIAISAIVLAVGCLIGVVIAYIIQSSQSQQILNLTIERDSLNTNLNRIYGLLNVGDTDEATRVITNRQVLSGADILAIDTELRATYGNNYRVDSGDATINVVEKNTLYKVVSLGIAQEDGTARAVLYAKHADGIWKLTRYNRSSDEPCRYLTDADVEAVQTIDLCMDNEASSGGASN